MGGGGALRATAGGADIGTRGDGGASADGGDAADAGGMSA
jgi:hypothetical protein